MLNTKACEETKAYVEKMWDTWFVPGISDFVRIPNLS